MSSNIPINEDNEISCRVLSHLLSRDISPVERNYLFRDFQTKSRHLQADIKKRLVANVMTSFLPPDSDDLIDMFKEMPAGGKRSVDILIVTIKSKELLGAQISLGIDPQKDKEKYRINSFRFWEKTISTISEGKVRVALTMIGRARTVPCAVACSKFSII